MDREKLTSDRFLKIHLENGELLVVDVNNLNDDYERILNQKQKIIRIETCEWTWNLVSNEIIFH
jgi:hypothetical protein